MHSVEAAVQAERDGADLIQLGTIFATSSKPNASPAGLDLVQEVAKVVSILVLAIGGVKPENVAEVIKAGASGAAVISAVCSADDPKAAAEALVQAMAEAWKERLGEKANV